ncbi:helix-turn-helix transcriptional regulator [Sphingomonas faeni]|uniref:helix-turn-helix transcriptional regulator n=1 Tax=Sphingomonas faeni TaxID=185950 RepID=UPI002781A810|nr:AlpA family phage regulatory protein [Sphingomonas faeni]MDQ0836979.1 putative DNA-binding transcriptional regulator AlpA [Sphingomonas faeni]
MIVEAGTVAHTEFWPLTRVQEVTGLSKTTLYELMKTGKFPRSYSYQFTDKRRFWLSNDVKRWQQDQVPDRRAELKVEIDNDFDALLK